VERRSALGGGRAHAVEMAVGIGLVVISILLIAGIVRVVSGNLGMR
jgi:hypothetical protein